MRSYEGLVQQLQTMVIKKQKIEDEFPFVTAVSSPSYESLIPWPITFLNHLLPVSASLEEPEKILNSSNWAPSNIGNVRLHIAQRKNGLCV